jgi:hypothetical protein
MEKFILIVVIAICQAFIAIIPVKNKISDNRRRFPRDFTKAGWTLIALCIVTVICSIWIFYISDYEQTQSQSKLENGLRRRDSIYRLEVKHLSNNYAMKVDSSYKKSEETFITVTARYGLHYDSLNHQLIKQIDTTKVEIQPDLTVEDIKIDTVINDYYKIGVTLFSNDAAANNIDLSYQVIVVDKDNKVELIPGISRAFIKSQSLSKDRGTTTLLRFSAKNASMFVLLLTGNYTNFTGTKKHFVQQFFSYSISGKQFGTPNTFLVNKISEILAENGIKLKR